MIEFQRNDMTRLAESGFEAVKEQLWFKDNAFEITAIKEDGMAALMELDATTVLFRESTLHVGAVTTLLLYNNHHEYGENIRKVLHDVVQVESGDSIRLKFKNPSFEKKGNLRKERRSLVMEK